MKRQLHSLPETWKCLMLPLLPSRTVDSCTTDIWLVVSVPVLSLQITVVHPRVSTEGSFLQHDSRTKAAPRHGRR
jgi:hypothetical protein